ncbi:NUDIX hydrolase [Actibacterium sp. D379-3]
MDISPDLSPAASPDLFPLHRQVAALCYRRREGETNILLLTSRGQGRWILPKGWPIAGLDDAGSALQEAWEEAGVKSGRVAPRPIGSFCYSKRLKGAGRIWVRADIFPVEVTRLARTWPEFKERKRAWVTPQKAARLVRDPTLRDILRVF